MEEEERRRVGMMRTMVVTKYSNAKVSGRCSCGGHRRAGATWLHTTARGSCP